ncbi:MAG: hypothetical protein MJ060_02560, partial [Clostridia bacterium]|nr:hypothetical protein [Clostridia bacterium]
MGNKRKVALVIVLSVVVSAVAVFAAVGESLRRFNVANEPTVDAASYSGNTFTVSSTDTATFPSSVYMILFSGSNGGGDSDVNTAYNRQKFRLGGNGATCIAYFKGSSMSISQVTGGSGGSWQIDPEYDEGNNRIVGESFAGGYGLTVTSNFAQPSGYSSSYSVTAGGGGGGVTILSDTYFGSASSNCEGKIVTGGIDAGFNADDSFWSYYKQHPTDTISPWYWSFSSYGTQVCGERANQTDAGHQGYMGNSMTYKNGPRTSAGARATDDDWGSYPVYGAGGGGGYKSGGGGGGYSGN